MVKAGLFDHSFPNKASASLGGEAVGGKPLWVHWERDTFLPVTFFTDMCLEQARYVPDRVKCKVAWLIEPPSLQDGHYKFVQENMHLFDFVLTFDRAMVNTYPKCLYYPFGGTWIKEADWAGSTERYYLLSMIASSKTGAVGHRLRHEIAKEFGDKIDLFGTGYNPIKSKREGLTPYYFSIVVESCQLAGYFSEKLIDCLSQRTMPIYWGAPDIHQYFDWRGILTFNTLDDLGEILESLLPDVYQDRYDAPFENQRRAKLYTICEDWIYRKYPFLFRWMQDD